MPAMLQYDEGGIRSGLEFETLTAKALFGREYAAALLTFNNANAEGRMKIGRA